MQHRTAPDDGLILVGEEAHGNAAHTVHLGWDEHLIDDYRRSIDPEHPRDRKAPHVGIDDGDTLASSARAQSTDSW